jgi:hypothetical protein
MLNLNQPLACVDDAFGEREKQALSLALSDIFYDRHKT